ncbi:MAG TPA: MFS transporter [Methylomirabilota bacterium]
MRARGGATVAAVWLILAVAYGVYFSFSIFLVPLLEEFGWSRGLTAGAFSVSAVVQGVLAPVTGVLVDRVGARRVIVGGVLVLGAASLLASTISAPWQLYLYTGVIGAVGLVALGWVPMGVLLSHWFAKGRARMVGIAFSGMGMGVFVIGPLAQWLIARAGWRAASAWLGAGTITLLLPIAWTGTRDPRPVAAPRDADARTPRDGSLGRALDDGTAAARADVGVGDAVRDARFWALWLAYFFTPLAVFTVFTHQVAFAVDLGFDRLLVASIFGVMGLMSTGGRIVFGVLADRIGPALAASVSFACTAGGACALLALETSAQVAWLWGYALLFGLGFGARGPIITAMATEHFGGRRFGLIYGVLNLGNGVGAAIAPWFGGVVHDVTGSYRLAFLSAVVFSILGAACFWRASRPSP